MFVKTKAPQHATRRKLRAAYNRGYLAGRKSPNHKANGSGREYPLSEVVTPEQQQKVEVALNYGDLSISIRTDK